MNEEDKQNGEATNAANEISAEELKLVSGGGIEIFFTIDGITDEPQKIEDGKSR